jgi:CheY-like chemotaxis protein
MKIHDSVPVAKSVLIVDDDADTLETLKLTLGVFHFDVSCASSGPEALKLATQIVPDAIVLDISMPMLDGFAVAKALRQIPVLADILIIAHSAHAEINYCIRAQDAGVDFYLSKPADPEFLVACLSPHQSAGVLQEISIATRLQLKAPGKLRFSANKALSLRAQHAVEVASNATRVGVV